MRLSTTERLDVLNRLQRNGAAVAACECGSFAWLSPQECYLSFAGEIREATGAMPSRLLMALTCAKCGFVKLFDPIVAGAMPNADGHPA